MSKLTRMLGKAERKLDEHGKPAWIAAMVLGFIVVWPVGLAILGYMIWSGRMGCTWKRDGRHERVGATGNTAFDAYREATLKRLEEEREAFSAYLEKLRRAKDQSEFDGFMAERREGGPQTA